MYGHLRPCSFMTGHAPGSPLLCTRAPVRRATGLLGQLPQSQTVPDPRFRATPRSRVEGRAGGSGFSHSRVFPTTGPFSPGLQGSFFYFLETF